ncbi:unnamed protein product [Allacma fusca]|uniref:Reverse transcriptase domain-containing protein n=1 Tax=Allacma fusca TaxID=39272 RepID=A0A8J2K766_9HEXA|nr:unnamed protein product [Allacma fusca]
MLKILNGVLQGETLSPTLFTLYLDEITMLLKNSNEKGAKLFATEIPILLYADDIVLMADSPQDLQTQIKIWIKFFKNNCLAVNMDKTKVVVFGRGRHLCKHDFYYDGTKIEIVNNYRYLGVEFHRKGHFKLHQVNIMNKREAATNVLLNTLRSAKVQDIKIILRPFTTLVETIRLYGFPIWGMKFLDNMEKLQTKFLRKILGASNLTPGHVLGLETGCKPIKSHIMKGILITILNTFLAETSTEEAKDCFKYIRREENQCPNSNMYTKWRNLFRKYNIGKEFDNLNYTYLIIHGAALHNKIDQELLNEDVKYMLMTESP